MGLWWRESHRSRHPKLSSLALQSTTIDDNDDNDDDRQHVSSGSRSLEYDRAGWERRRKKTGGNAAWRQTWQTGDGPLRSAARHRIASDCITWHDAILHDGIVRCILSPYQWGYNLAFLGGSARPRMLVSIRADLTFVVSCLVSCAPKKGYLLPIRERCKTFREHVRFQPHRREERCT